MVKWTVILLLLRSCVDDQLTLINTKCSGWVVALNLGLSLAWVLALILLG